MFAKFLLPIVFISVQIVTNLFASENLPLKEAWIAFASSRYFNLLEVTISSVHEFSTRPIIAIGINDDIPFSTDKYPRLIKRRIDEIIQPGCFFNLKPRIILESNVEYGVYIEADDILNEGCDTLFDYAHQVIDYPLCPLHPDDPNNQQLLMNFLGITQKSMAYVHGHVVFSQKCMPFIKEWYETCLQHAYCCSNYDETVLNVLLWKYKAKELLPLYDPHYSFSEDYLRINEPKTSLPDCHWYMFHGCKDHKEAWTIFNKLKEKALPTEIDSQNQIDHTKHGKVDDLEIPTHQVFEILGKDHIEDSLNQGEPSNNGDNHRPTDPDIVTHH